MTSSQSSAVLKLASSPGLKKGGSGDEAILKLCVSIVNDL